MSEVEMLCLANSRKHGGRCVAGLTKDGSWIRPVTATEDGALAAHMCILDVGRAVHPLDVVRLRVEQRAPRPHQPENCIVTDEPWKLLRERNLLEVEGFLDGVATGEPKLFGTTTNKVDWTHIQENGTPSSLALVKAAGPIFSWSPFSPAQRRARFEHCGFSYDLPITFDFELPRVGEAHHRSASNSYFTISLGEPFASRGHDCFKLIAGALEVPPHRAHEGPF